MVHVVLKTGKVIRYNYVDDYSSWNGMVSFNRKATHTCVALIPTDVIERIEWTRPCDAIHDKNGKQIKVKY